MEMSRLRVSSQQDALSCARQVPEFLCTNNDVLHRNHFRTLERRVHVRFQVRWNIAVLAAPCFAREFQIDSLDLLCRLMLYLHVKFLSRRCSPFLASLFLASEIAVRQDVPYARECFFRS